jgi:hypothetical protein
MTTPPFPVHLRLTHGHSVYRIASDTEFTEVQRVGSRFIAHRITALTWPERLRIADMLANADRSLDPITEAEFEEWLARAEQR